MANERTDDSLLEKFQAIECALRDERNKKIEIAQQTMRGLLQEVQEGIRIVELYGRLEENGFNEAIIRSAFLDLAQGGEVDLTSDRRVVLVQRTNVE